MLLYFFGLGLLITQAFASINNTIEEIPDYYVNSTDNPLWRTLLKNCKSPTTQCVGENMYKYLNQVLEYPKDYNVTSFLKFAKNSVSYIKTENGNDSSNSSDEDANNNLNNARSSIEELSQTLHENGVKFFMTHDLEVKMPDTFFDGATFKIAPRGFDGNGALVKMEFLPKQIPDDAVEGRIFFKKIKKKISQKLLYALLAILLVIKLLAAKFLFFIPMMMGVAAAKKLLIKVLFFLFPAIKHLFKLCPYVPQATKYHHHKHHIAHIHHLGHHHHPHPHHHDDGIEIIHPHSDGPPLVAGSSSLHHYVDIDPPHSPSYRPHEQDLGYYSEGPSLGPEIINHRKDSDLEENEISGQGYSRPSKKNMNRPLTPTEIEYMVLKAEKEALIKAKLQQEKKRIQEENARLQEQLRRAIKIQEQLKLQQLSVLSRTNPLLLKGSLPTVPSPFLRSPPPPPHEQILPVNTLFKIPNQLVPLNVVKYTGPQEDNIVANALMNNPGLEVEAHQGMSMLSRQGAAISPKGTNVVSSDKVVSTSAVVDKKPPAKPVKKSDDFQKAIQQAASITYDTFYSPILEKIDKILTNLGYTNEPCKERLICFMYKSPDKYSPHSNLVSNELSRDAKELQKPKNTNAVVVRFYRYLQAARDGQDKNNCINLYPGCDVLGSEL